MWQVQYDVKGSERFEVNLNTTSFATKEEERDGRIKSKSTIPFLFLNTTSFATKEEERDGRFTLYPTQNMWTFILLDQIDGRMWQVQWSMKEDSRFVIQI